MCILFVIIESYESRRLLGDDCSSIDFEVIPCMIAAITVSRKLQGKCLFEEVCPLLVYTCPLFCHFMLRSLNDVEKMPPV